MKTQIFKDYLDFLNREDKEINGVSEDFAAENPNYEKENESNKACWNCSGCSRCSDCSDCSGCSRCSDCSDCSDCSHCSRCSDCSDCSHCSRCSDCSGLKNNKPTEFPGFVIPTIENIHTKVYEAASQPKALDMSDWHTCDTTHCRAGWAVHLAGEAGKELERQTSTLFAAMQIYKKSSDIRVYPPRFFEPNQTALDDMKRCAELEANKI